MRSSVLSSLVAVGAAGCSLFSDLGGFSGGERTELGDAGPDAFAASSEAGTSDGGPDAADVPDPPSSGQYQRTLTISNVASSPLPVDHAVCATLPGSDTIALVGSKIRPDFGDLRVIGPSGAERKRTVDVRGAALVLCFRLERAIFAGLADSGYALRYGDASATAPPHAHGVVFGFFDGFDGTALAPVWLAWGTPSVTGGNLVLPQASANGITTASLSDGIPVEASLEIRARVVDPTSAPEPQSSFYYWFGFQHTGDFDAFEPWQVFIARSASEIHAEMKSTSGPCVAGCGSGASNQTTDFRVYRIDRTIAATHFTFDNGATFSADGNNGDQSIMIRSYLRTSDVLVDWVRARPLVWPEPTFALGAEQASP